MNTEKSFHGFFNMEYIFPNYYNMKFLPITSAAEDKCIFNYLECLEVETALIYPHKLENPCNIWRINEYFKKNQLVGR